MKRVISFLLVLMFSFLIYETAASSVIFATQESEVIPLSAESYLMFVPLADGTYSVKAKNVNNVPETVKIPATYNGVAVTSIRDYGFMNCSTIKSIELPEGMKTISSYAFYGCSDLAQVNVSSVTETVGAYAFYGCGVLQEIELPLTVSKIDMGAFRACTALTSIVYEGSKEQWNAIPKGTNWDLNTGNFKMTYLGGGEDDTEEYSYLDFALLSDGTYSVKAKNINNMPETVKIPAAYNGVAVTSIRDYGFMNCNMIKNIELSDKIKTIGNYAFYGCSNLSKITIGNTVETINNYAFCGCNSLETVIIPSSVTTVGMGAFRNCSKLISIVYKGTEDEWNSIPKGDKWDLNTGDYEITYLKKDENPNYFTYILLSDGTYSITVSDGVELPSKLEIPASYNEIPVTYIRGYTFMNHTTLTSVVIPESIKTIGAYAFYGCSNLSKITIGNTVETINNYAFCGCNSLETVIIPSSVATVGMGAFRNCSKLISIVYEGTEDEWNSIPKGDKWDLNAGDYEITYLGEDNIEQNYFTYILLSDGTYSVKATDINHISSEIVIPATYNGIKVTSIWNYGFMNCTTLTSVEIPKGLSNIEEYAFYGCSNLINLKFSNSTKVIGDYAFCNCVSLKEVNLPASIISIGKGAFRHCQNINSIIYKNTESEWEIVSKGIEWDYDIKDYMVTFKNISSGLRYTLDTTGTYYIVSSIGDCTDTEIVIPARYNNLPVKEIGVFAFSQCANVTSIEIPDTIIKIDACAFIECPNLNDIIMDNMQNEWKSIAKSVYWDYSMGNYIFHFNDGNINAFAWDMRGDMNGDGIINSTDIGHLRNHLQQPDQYILKNSGDVNGDGRVTEEDEKYLFNHLSLPSEYPLKNQCIGNHVSVIDMSVSPTCTSAGLSEGEHCYICDKILKSQTEIGKLVHQYSARSTTYVDDLEYIIYQCELCHEKIEKPKEDGIEAIYEKEAHLFDCTRDFYFDVIYDKDISYLQENLIIIDDFFRGTEYETHENAKVDFVAEKIGDTIWRIKPKESYLSYTTYFVKLLGEVSFKEYLGKHLTFEIGGEEKKIADFRDDILFLKKIESEIGGYYPYTLDFNEESKVYKLVLSKQDGFDHSIVGKILCVGDYESIEEIIADNSKSCVFGKVEEVIFNSNGTIALYLGYPKFSEIYEKLDIYTKEDLHIDESSLPENFDEEIKNALVSSEQNR